VDGSMETRKVRVREMIPTTDILYLAVCVFVEN
jgi:hypothetical protein